MKLLINYYIDQDFDRQKELDFCLLTNLDNNLIDNVYVFCLENEKPTIKNDKLVIKTWPTRPTYKELFEFGSTLRGVKIIANSDIYFDETIGYTKSLWFNQIFALCRWNVTNDGIEFYSKLSSQDVWIWRGEIKISADYTLGVPGCDNALAYEIEKRWIQLLSPSLTIRAYHLHHAKKRNYEKSIGINKTKVKPPYKFLEKFY